MDGSVIDMLSIDEAIEKHKKLKILAKGTNDKRGAFYSAKEHEKIAEWLELLKWYQQGMEDIPSESGVLPKDVYHAGYENAIDDLIAKCENAKFAESDEISLSDIHTGVNSGLSMAIHFAKELRGGNNEVN